MVRGLARLARGPDYGAVIFAQHFEPGADIVGVPDRRHNAERCAAEGRRNLGDQFLERVLLRTKGAGQVAVKPVRRSASMGTFVQRRSMPIDLLEVGLRRWDLYVVRRWRVEGAVPADAEVDAGPAD